MNRPSPVPPQQTCKNGKHENTYYDAKGLRCKDCHEYVRRYPPVTNEGPEPEVPLEKEFPDLWYPLDEPEVW